MVAAGDDTAVNARIVGKAVEQIGIALTYRRPVPDGCIGRELQLVARILQMGIVVPDLLRDPVVDGLHLLIGGLGVQRQLRPHGTADIVVQPLLLCRRGVPDGTGVVPVRPIGNVVLVLPP